MSQPPTPPPSDPSPPAGGSPLGAGGDPVILCLCERHELDERYPDYVDWLESGIDGARWVPVHDLGAPSPDAARALGAEVNRWLDAGRPVIIHCGAGLGRAPTIAACALLSRGHELDGILAAIADSRPMAGPESGAQRDLLDTLAAEGDASGPC